MVAAGIVYQRPCGVGTTSASPNLIAPLVSHTESLARR